MKKQLFILFLILFNVFFFFYSLNYNVLAQTIQEKKFAQVQKDGVFFYSKDKSELFVLPKTFYCQILSPVDSQGFYYCKYINCYGYVKKSDVQCVSGEISAPFLDYVNFRVLASQSAELRSSPTREDGANSLICTLDLYQTNFILYGTKQGEEVVSKRGTDWFYCEYFSGNSSVLGYVYSGLCDQVKNHSNLEINPNPIDEFAWKSSEDTVQNTADETITFVIPDSNQMLIIICISVPILILLLTLFVPFKSAKSINNKPEKASDENKNSASIINMPKRNKRINRAEKGKDFYELK